MSATVPAEAGVLRPWHYFVVCALIAATVAVFLARDNSPENLVLVSLTVLAGGLAGLAFHRTLWPLVSADTESDTAPRGSRARVALEREKALVLRAIKELEFDRAMGKVAEPDFEDMSARLRTRAIGLMRQLDDQQAGYRDAIERDVAQRLQARGKVLPASVRPAPMAAAAAGCPQCRTANDADARFCKSCGARLCP